jgi:hypothetical protein
VKHTWAVSSPSWSSTFRNYTPPEPRFRALLNEGDAQVALSWRGVRPYR